MKARLAVLLLILPYMWLGCAASGNSGAQTWEQKVDPRLRAEILDFKTAGENAKSFPVIIKFRAPLSAEHKQELEAAGIRLLSQTGELATAVLSTEAISELTRKDYVIYLEASKERTLTLE